MKKYFYELMCVVLWVVMASPVWAETREELALRNKALPLLKQKQYEDAIKIYTDAAAHARDDDALQAHSLTFAAQYTQDYLKDDEAALKLASQIRDQARASSLRLVLLSEAKRYEQAISEFADTDISVWPVDVQVDSYYARAIAHIELGNADKAEPDLDAGSQTPGNTPRRLWLCYQLGEFHKARKNMDKASEAYQRGLAITTANYAWRNRCFIAYTSYLLESGDAEKALEQYKTIDYDKLPSDYYRGEFYLLQAEIQSKLGNNGHAASLWTKVLRLPDGIKAHKATAEKKLQGVATNM